MKDAEEAPGYGRTNWRRFGIAVGIPVVGAAGILLALQQGALAANFAVSGQNFHLTASHLHGDGFIQYSGIEKTADGNPHVAGISAISHATMSNLCQSVSAPAPFGLGTFTLRIEAGGAKSGKQVVADNLLIGMTDLKGDATFGNINIGQDASTLSQAGAGAVPGAAYAGGFGQGASTVDIDNLQQTASSTQASSFTLNGMHLSLSTSNKDCFVQGYDG